MEPSASKTLEGWLTSQNPLLPYSAIVLGMESSQRPKVNRKKLAGIFCARRRVDLARSLLVLEQSRGDGVRQFLALAEDLSGGLATERKLGKLLCFRQFH